MCLADRIHRRDVLFEASGDVLYDVGLIVRYTDEERFGDGAPADSSALWAYKERRGVTSQFNSTLTHISRTMSFEPGTYVLTNVKAGAAMDLSGGDNQSIIAFNRHGGPNQQWKFEQAGDGANDGKQVIGHDGPRPWEVRVGHEGVNVKDEQESIRIFVPGTEQNLDLKDHGDATAGNIVQLWSRTPGKGQAWYFEKVY
ncbi:ricin-type beta-trefoil lectin domain protein [Ceratobasidium sp. AG-Ba]|nr:ricin-type beta-trefoil lectin domain protein [Ceratobasidium sp. AG-Ba]